MTKAENTEIETKTLRKPVKQRLLSIDALRGFDMFWILGAEGIFAALFIVTGWSFFNVAAGQMLHSNWHGFTAYDLIFPLFIFLSGVSLGIAAKPLASYAKAQQKQKLRHAHKRLFLLICLGIIYNHAWGGGIPLSIDEIRFASVLGRIAIAWYVAAMLVWYLSERMQWYVSGIILLGYWLLLGFLSIGDLGAGDYTSTGAINVWFDQNLLPGITYQNLPLDPEGILSNIPSIVNAMAGVFIGRILIKYQQQPMELLGKLIAIGLACLLGGYVWDFLFPINKTLWTSSFVLVTCGYSCLLLVLFYYLIDVLKFQRWAVFFSIIGTNSIVAYLATSIVDWKFIAGSLFGGVIASVSPSWQGVIQVVALVFVQWLILYWLYQRKIFVKV